MDTEDGEEEQIYDLREDLTKYLREHNLEQSTEEEISRDI